MKDPAAPAAASLSFPCSSCGALLKHEAGTHDLLCPYCGSVTPITMNADAKGARSVEEHEIDYVHALLQKMAARPAQEHQTLACSHCAASFTIAATIASDLCPYCGHPFATQVQTALGLIPDGLLPFKLKEQEAQKAFVTWVRSRWFAPNAFNRLGRTGSRLQGIFLAHWTFDAEVHTSYTGERGEHYWDTEHYTDSQGNHRTRSVRKTRWYSASGTVYNSFDDILVVGSHALPREDAAKLEPWHLEDIVPFDERYLAGYRTETLSVPLEQGYKEARTQAEPVILASIRQDIGGDEQRIHSHSSRYSDVTCKYILLPTYSASYVFQAKTFRILVNARTGEVQGQRPWSWIKITLAILAGLGLVSFIANLIAQQ